MLFREIPFLFLSSFSHFIMLGCPSRVSPQPGTELLPGLLRSVALPCHTVGAPLVCLSSSYLLGVVAGMCLWLSTAF